MNNRMRSIVFGLLIGMGLVCLINRELDKAMLWLILANQENIINKIENNNGDSNE